VRLNPEYDSNPLSDVEGNYPEVDVDGSEEQDLIAQEDTDIFADWVQEVGQKLNDYEQLFEIHEEANGNIVNFIETQDRKIKGLTVLVCISYLLIVILFVAMIFR